MGNRDTDDDLRGAIAHHDLAIGQLATRVSHVETAIEQGFAKVDQRFGSLGSDVADIKNALVKNEASKGPSLSDLVKIVLGGGGIVALAASAITVLVLSFTAPALTKLDDSAAVFQKDLDARQDEARKELAALRKAERDALAAEVNDLKSEVAKVQDKIAWIGRVEKK
jgi:hypothetical protein